MGFLVEVYERMDAGAAIRVVCDLHIPTATEKLRNCISEEVAELRGGQMYEVRSPADGGHGRFPKF